MRGPTTCSSGLALSSTGQHELAIAETEKAIALDPDLTPAYASKAFNQLMLNRLDDALLTVGLASERRLESDASVQTQYFVAFLTGNENELRRIATAARKSPATEEIISHMEALALARAGQLQEARRMAAVAVQIAQKSGRRERAGLFEAATAVWEAFYGNAAAASQSAARALELGKDGREVEYAAAFALALAGDLPQSRGLAEVLARDFPDDTSVQFMYLPALRALFSLNLPLLIRQRRFKRCRPPRATIWLLGVSALSDVSAACIPSMFADWRTLPHVNPPRPPPSSSGLSIIAASCSSIPWTRWRACSWHERSRSLATPAKAKTAYNDLFTLWKNADPDIPVLNDARAEYARLP